MIEQADQLKKEAAAKQKADEFEGKTVQQDPTSEPSNGDGPNEPLLRTGDKKESWCSKLLRCLGCCGCLSWCCGCLLPCCACVRGAMVRYINFLARVMENAYQMLTYVIARVSVEAVAFILPPAINLDYGDDDKKLTKRLRTLDKAYEKDFEEAKQDDTKDQTNACQALKRVVCCVGEATKESNDQAAEDEEDYKAAKIALVCITCKSQVEIMLLQFSFIVGVRFVLHYMSGESEFHAFVDACETTFLERSIITFMGSLAGKAVHAKGAFHNQVATHAEVIHFIQARLYQLWYML